MNSIAFSQMLSVKEFGLSDSNWKPASEVEPSGQEFEEAQAKLLAQKNERKNLLERKRLVQQAMMEHDVKLELMELEGVDYEEKEGKVNNFINKNRREIEKQASKTKGTPPDPELAEAILARVNRLLEQNEQMVGPSTLSEVNSNPNLTYEEKTEILETGLRRFQENDEEDQVWSLTKLSSAFHNQGSVQSVFLQSHNLGPINLGFFWCHGSSTPRCNTPDLVHVSLKFRKQSKRRG